MADVIIGGDDQEGSSQGFFPGNHKKTSAAHLAFKAIAWTLYLLGGVLSFSIVALYSIIVCWNYSISLFFFLKKIFL